MTDLDETKPPRILSLIPAEPGWVATVYYSEKDDEGRSTVTGTERHRVHGWALVDSKHGTGFEPMYVEDPGFPTCASLHNSYAPDRVTVYAHHEPEATDLTEPRIDRGGFEVPLDANGDTAWERAAKADDH